MQGVSSEKENYERKGCGRDMIDEPSTGSFYVDFLSLASRYLYFCTYLTFKSLTMCHQPSARRPTLVWSMLTIQSRLLPSG